jgi:hypothetical protein
MYKVTLAVFVLTGSPHWARLLVHVLLSVFALLWLLHRITIPVMTILCLRNWTTWLLCWLAVSKRNRGDVTTNLRRRLRTLDALGEVFLIAGLRRAVSAFASLFARLVSILSSVCVAVCNVLVVCEPWER